MKNNLPVTQTEKTWIAGHGRYIVSKTDLKGVITYVNDLFVEMSGFSREELIGKSHNIVRHPDVPPLAFEDLWNHLKDERPWRGIVKNRCKNGDHYWVDAFVSPQRKDGRTVGYVSIRRQPGAAAIQAAEAAYRQLAARGAKLPAASRLARLRLGTVLAALMAAIALLLVGGGVMGVGGLHLANRSIESIYVDRMQPTNAMSKIQLAMSANFAQASAALQHDPANPLSKMHDHPVTKHADAIAGNRAEIAALWKGIMARPLSPKERELAEKYATARGVFVDDTLMPLRAALVDGDYPKAATLFSMKANKTYADANAAAEALLGEMLAASEREFAQTTERYHLVRLAAVVGILASIAFVTAAAVWMARRYIRPIVATTAVFDRIAGGKLCNEIDISRRDEIGAMQADLAIMQAHLAALIDDIEHVSATVEARSHELDGQMARVAERSGAQRGSVERTAAAVEEVGKSVEEVSAAATDAFQAAFRSQDIVASASRRMAGSVEAVGRVVATVGTSAATMAELREAIDRIGDVTGVIRDIADQTNLLALNAAIEAARAGEQGRGFAVVADEVRKLAERTAASTADIVQTVDTVHRAMETAAVSMKSTRREVDDSIGLMRESMGSLTEIAAAGNEVTGKSQHIAAAVQQQAAAMRGIARDMAEVTALIEENAAAAQHASAATAALAAMAERLNEQANFDGCDA